MSVDRLSTSAFGRTEGEEEKEASPQSMVEVYRYDGPGHIRAMTLFTTSQVLYWTTLSVDAWVVPVFPKIMSTGTTSIDVPPSQVAAASSGSDALALAQESSELIEIAFATHPMICFLGLSASAVMAWLTHYYSHVAVSRLFVDPDSDRVAVSTYSVLGNPLPLSSFKAADLKPLEPGPKADYVSIVLPGSNRTGLLVYRKGAYSPANWVSEPFHDPGPEPQSQLDNKERAVLGQFGDPATNPFRANVALKKPVVSSTRKAKNRKR